MSASAGTRNAKSTMKRFTASYMRLKSGHTPSATPLTSIRYVEDMPKMWWSGRSISERSPAPIGSAFEPVAANDSIAASVSSAPRGTVVVPLVKTIVATAGEPSAPIRAGPLPSQRANASFVCPPCMKMSAASDPNPTRSTPGMRRDTSIAFSPYSDEWAIVFAPTNSSLSHISSAVRLTSSGTATEPERRQAACATIHWYEFSPRMPIVAPGQYFPIAHTTAAMSSVNCRHEIGTDLSPDDTRNAGASGVSARNLLNASKITCTPPSPTRTAPNAPRPPRSRPCT